MSQDATIGTASASAGFIAGVTTSIVATIGYLGIAFLILLISYITLAAIFGQKGNNPMRWRCWNPQHWCWNPVKWLTKDCGKYIDVSSLMPQNL